VEADVRRRVRPLLWVIFGSLAVLVGLGMAVSAVGAATRVKGVDGAPACTTDFASGCTTKRAAVLDDSGYVRGSWFTQEQKWFASVPGGAPGLKSGERLKIMVPRQNGIQELNEGSKVTLVYYAQSPAWIQLPSGTVLETEDHPRRAAPSLGWMALASLGGGIFGIQTGIRSRRREGAWWRRVPGHIAFGPAGLLFPAGCFGLLGQTIAGGTIWPGVAGGLVGIGLGAMGWRRSRRREASSMPEGATARQVRAGARDLG
jgi:hypothetical protein